MDIDQPHPVIQLAILMAPEAFGLPVDAPAEDCIWMWAREGYFRVRELRMLDELDSWDWTAPPEALSPEILLAAAGTDFDLTGATLDVALTRYATTGLSGCIEDRDQRLVSAGEIKARKL